MHAAGVEHFRTFRDAAFAVLHNVERFGEKPFELDKTEGPEVLWNSVDGWNSDALTDSEVRQLDEMTS